VLSQAVDLNDGTLSVVSAGQGALGTTTVNADGTITYTPTGGPGTDSFTFTVSNSGESTTTATAHVTVVDASGLLAAMMPLLDPTGIVTSASFDALSSPSAAGVVNLNLPGLGQGAAVLSTGSVDVLTTSPEAGVDNGTLLGGSR